MLAEKTGRFVPRDPLRRAVAMQYLMLAVTDIARTSTSIFLCSSVVAGQVARQRRLLRGADAALPARRRCAPAGRELLADELSVADFALYPLFAARKALIDRAADLRELTRWGAAMAARPGVAKGMRACE